MTDVTSKALHELADEFFRLTNAHDLDGLDAMHAPGYVSHEPQGDTGVTEFRATLAAFFTGFPDAYCTPVNIVAEGDRLVMHLETTGTHTAEYLGMPPTGKHVRFTEIRVRRVEDGKFAEHWGLLDVPTFMAQLQ